MKRRKLVKSESIVTPGERLHDLSRNKYPGVLEGDEIKHTKMKRRIENKYFRLVQKIFKSKLKGALGIWFKPSVVEYW